MNIAGLPRWSDTGTWSGSWCLTCMYSTSTLFVRRRILCRNRTREGTRHGDAKIAKAFMEMVVLVINMYQASHVSQVHVRIWRHVSNLHNRLPSTFLPASQNNHIKSLRKKQRPTDISDLSPFPNMSNATVRSATFVRR
jgi:hypothetical protein